MKRKISRATAVLTAFILAVLVVAPTAAFAAPSASTTGVPSIAGITANVPASVQLADTTRFDFTIDIESDDPTDDPDEAFWCAGLQVIIDGIPYSLDSAITTTYLETTWDLRVVGVELPGPGSVPATPTTALNWADLPIGEWYHHYLTGVAGGAYPTPKVTGGSASVVGQDYIGAAYTGIGGFLLTDGVLNFSVRPTSPSLIGSHTISFSITPRSGFTPTTQGWAALTPATPYAFNVVNLNAPVIAETTLLDVEVGGSYAVPALTLSSPGTPSSFAWSLTGATWLTIGSATGVITGTAPATPGPVNVTVGLITEYGTTSKEFSIAVNEAPGAFTPADNTALASGTQNTPYTSAAITVASGYPAPVLAPTTPLPAGLGFDASTGVISGTPTSYGNYSVAFEATVTSARGAAVGTPTTASYTIAIAEDTTPPTPPAPSVLPTPPSVVGGEKYENGGWYFYETGKTQPTLGEVTLPDGRVVYYTDDGMQFGMVNVGGVYHYYNLGNGRRLTGEQNVSGRWYYFDPAANGDRVTGHFTLPDGRQVYYTYAGMQFGMVNVGGGVYRYYNINNGRLYTGGELNVNGSWYYFDTVTGDRFSGGEKYLALGSRTVYYAADGTMQFGEVTVGGVTHYYNLGNGKKLW